jgi:fumarate hydratase class I
MLQLIRERFEKTEYTAFETAEKPVLRDGRLFVPAACLEALALEAFRRMAFFYRRTHLELLAAACDMAGTGASERLLINSLLENAVIAAEGRLPLCQDTGTAFVYAWKPENVITGADDRAALERGIGAAYKKYRLRASQLVPVSFFDERNTGNNLPACIHTEAVPPEDPLGEASPGYRFMFAAKGGGSSNKTSYFPASPDILSEAEFDRFLREKITALGTAACPPYRLAVVAGGLSPEHNLETLKLATTELLDGAPYFGAPEAAASERPFPVYRDSFWEKRAMEIAEQSGLGAQLGGKRLVLDVRVLRLGRHAASCPVSIGVSCTAHRNMLAFIDKRGIFLEKLEENPAGFLKTVLKDWPSAAPDGHETPRVSLDRPMTELCALLSGFKTGTALLVSGKMLVARDAAHLAWRKLIENRAPLPEYLFKYPVFYSGPSETPAGCVTGSIGPTTSARMDGFAKELLPLGASLVTAGKGGRSALWTETARKYGGAYLIAAGGAAALIASANVISVKVIDYPELAMEAVRLLEVKDLRVFKG